jgi:hypothetical protein
MLGVKLKVPKGYLLLIAIVYSGLRMSQRISILQKGMTHLHKEEENTMTLEEVVKKLTPEQRTASNTVGEDQIVVMLSDESEYSMYVGKPGWKFGQAPSSWEKLGVYRSVEQIKKRIATLSFTSPYDPNVWSVEKGANSNLSPLNQTSNKNV